MKQTTTKQQQHRKAVCAPKIQLKHTYVQCLGGCVRETNDKVGVGSAVLEGRVGVVVIVVRSTRPQSEHLVTWKEAGSKLSCHVHQLVLGP